MVELLARLVQEVDTNPALALFENDVLAERLRQDLAATKVPSQIVEIHARLASQLLQAGRSEEALKELDLSIESARQYGMRFDSRQTVQFDVLRAMSYLRIGEQENCVSNHTSESCLAPIRAGGVHKMQRGSRAAIAVLEENWKKFPKNLRARWLLNIAYMTVGEYPDKVPVEWVISPKVFESEYNIKRFPEVAANVGLDVSGQAGGSITEDFDGDGFVDVMISSWGLKGQLRLFHNNGDGTFVERTAEAGLTGLVGGLNIMQTDYNNDGWPDVFVPRGAWRGAGGHQPRSLLRNNGDGTFSDVTEEAGLLSFHPTQAVVWFDFNGDGWLDLFIGNESFQAEVHPCELYRNNGDGTFTECAAESGVAALGYIKGVSSADYNHDGRPDLYLSNRNGANFLFRNDGPAEAGGGSKSKWKFTNAAPEAGVVNPFYSFPTWFFDYDNDGWADIMVTGYSIRDVSDVAADYMGIPGQGEKAKLYHNNHDGTFKDVTAECGLNRVLHGMGVNFGDLDNDGWLDFYIGTGDPDLTTLIPNRMFRNDGGKRFQDVTTSGGFGNLQKGHGISFADLDNDGDQDIFEVMGGAYTGDVAHSTLFLNPGHGNHWITLKLEGVKSNRAAVGARIRVVVQTAEGERSIYKTVGTGASFGSSPLRQEIGLGQAKAIERVEILWPVTGEMQILPAMPMDHFYKVREGAQVAEAWDLKSFTIPTEARPPAHDHHLHTAVAR